MPCHVALEGSLVVLRHCKIALCYFRMGIDNCKASLRWCKPDPFGAITWQSNAEVAFCKCSLDLSSCVYVKSPYLFCIVNCYENTDVWPAGTQGAD